MLQLSSLLLLVCCTFLSVNATLGADVLLEIPIELDCGDYVVDTMVIGHGRLMKDAWLGNPEEFTTAAFVSTFSRVGTFR